MSYNEFMEKYSEEHYMCPQCHTRNFNQTCVAYVYNELHPEEYQDKNGVQCCTCGWHGTVHKLIPMPKKIGYKITYLTGYEKCKIDDKVYTKEEAKDLVSKLKKENPEKHYYWFPVEVNE